MIIDISQEILTCKVWPGDPEPHTERLCDMHKGDLYNLTKLSMCAHNGTHVDAPLHFIADGKSIDQLPLEPFVGDCYVARHDGDVKAEHAAQILKEAAKADASQRILIAGKATVTAEAAEVFAQAGILLIGNESQTVGPENAPMHVHRILLGAGVVLLEGIVLTDVKAGKYFLNAAPLNFSGCEGSPCRAILIR
ncbi:MAG: cyclase family protein [Clostridia bacterium]|nr:cyclase family protein [Clostridia bacterium]